MWIFLSCCAGRMHTWNVLVFNQRLVPRPTKKESRPGDIFLKSTSVIKLSVPIPSCISRKAETLIKQLCRTDPFARIGYQKGGFCDIRKHRWFQGFNWEALRNQALVLGSANRFHFEKSYEKSIFLNTKNRFAWTWYQWLQ